MSERETYRYPLTRCPCCGHEVDAATCVQGASAPDNGDISICLQCGGLSVFDGEPLGLRLPSEDERAEAMGDPEVIKHVGIVRRLAYQSPKFSERACDRCGKRYRGPAVYCSFECALADA